MAPSSMIDITASSAGWECRSFELLRLYSDRQCSKKEDAAHGDECSGLGGRLSHIYQDGNGIAARVQVTSSARHPGRLRRIMRTDCQVPAR